MTQHHEHGHANEHGHADEHGQKHNGHERHGHEHEDHGGHDHGHGHDHEHPGGLRGWVSGLFHPHSHDAADSVDAALESSALGVRAVKISLVGLAVTAVLQLLVVLASGSVARAGSCGDR